MEVLREYGQPAYFDVPLSYWTSSDFNNTPPTLSAGDVKISKNGGAFTNITTLPTHVGQGNFRVTLSAAEMSASSIIVHFIHASPTGYKHWTDQQANVATFGSVSGMYKFNLNLSNEVEHAYYADIQLNIDDTNSIDEYTISWFKDRAPLSSGGTVPQIQVIKRSDGTDLIPATGMTQIGSLMSFKYDASGAYRASAGETYIVRGFLTVDGSGREWYKNHFRDN